MPVTLNVPPVDRLPAVAVPVTVNDVSVPTLVTLGCAAVVNVPPTKVEVMFPALTLPLTIRDVNVPTLVIFGCAAVVTVPAVVAEPVVVANVAFATVPVTLAPGILFSPLALPVNTPVLAVNATAVIVLFTPNEVRVPRLVMLGCAAVVNVPAKKFALTVLPPDTLPALILPETVSDVKVPILVILG